MHARLIRMMLAAMLLTAMLSSCSYVVQRDVATQSQQTDAVEWTVLYYGAGNNSLDATGNSPSEVLATVENMRNIYTLGAVNIVACVNSDATGGRARCYNFPADPEQINEPMTLGYADWGTLDMSSAQTLSDFIEYAIATYPAEKYALVITGQGDGWHGALLDNTNGSGQLMGLSTFRQAVENTAAHFDLLAWFVPGMNSVEVAYECRPIADYMVACAWPIPHDVSRSPSVWLQDLAANPGMDAERFGMMMVDGLYEAAVQAHDSVHYALLRLANLENFVPEIDSLALALTPHTQENSEELPSLWTAAWVAQTDDSQSVDVGRLSQEVLADPELSGDPSVTEAAQHVTDNLNHLIVYHRTTVGGENRHGVSIFLPIYPDTVELAEYAALTLSTDHSGWSDLLRTTAASAPSRSLISGTVRWPGHALQNVYLFLNTNQSGAPNFSFMAPISVVEVISQDENRYQVYVVPGDSLPCYLGLFQDLDNSGTLTAGDRYGNFHTHPSPPRDWMTIYAGEDLPDINVELDRTF